MTFAWNPNPTNLRIRIRKLGFFTWQNVSNYVPRDSLRITWSGDSGVAQGSLAMTIPLALDTFSIDAWCEVRIDDETGGANLPTQQPSLTIGGAGSLAAGTYWVGYTYVFTFGAAESTISPLASLTVGPSAAIDVAAIAPLPANVTSVNWYVSRVVNSTDVRYSTNNAGTAFTITTAPGFTAQPPTAQPYPRYFRGFIQRAESNTQNLTKTYTVTLADGNVLLDKPEWVPNADTEIGGVVYQSDQNTLIAILQTYFPTMYPGDLDTAGINHYYSQLGVFTIKAGATLRESISQLQAQLASVRPVNDSSASRAVNNSTFSTGTYYYGYTWVTTHGETVISPLDTFTLNNSYIVHQPALWSASGMPPNVTAVRWYMSATPGATTLHRLSETNAQAAIDFSAPPSGGAATPPTTNPASDVPRFLLNWSPDDNAHTDTWRWEAHWLLDSDTPTDGVWLTDDPLESNTPPTYKAFYFDMTRLRDGLQLVNSVTVIGKWPDAHLPPPSYTATDAASISYVGRTLAAKPIVDTTLATTLACQTRADQELQKWSTIQETLSNIVCFVPYALRIPTRVKIKSTAEGGLGSYTAYVISQITLSTAQGVPQFALELGTGYPELGELGRGWRGGVATDRDLTAPAAPKWHIPPTAAVLADQASPSTTLATGTYYVRYTWIDLDSTESAPSPQASIFIGALHSIGVAAVTGVMPASAVSVNWYVSMSANSTTLKLYTNNSGGAFNITNYGTGATCPGVDMTADFPTNVYVPSTGNVTIQATWHANTEQDLSYYLAYWRVDNGTLVGSGPLFTNALTVVNLPPSFSTDLHTFNVEVAAFDTHGNMSAYSAFQSVQTAAPSVPDTPTSFAQTNVFDPWVGNDLVTYTWTPSTNIRVISYDIAVTTGGATYHHPVSGRLSDHFQDRVNPNNFFSVTITAFDSWGQPSPASTPITFTSAPIYVPDTPTSPSVTATGVEAHGKGWADIDFVVPGTSHGPIDQYETRIIGGGRTWSPLRYPGGQTPGSHTKIRIAGFTLEVTYTVEVRSLSYPVWYGGYWNALNVIVHGSGPPVLMGPGGSPAWDQDLYPFVQTIGTGITVRDATTLYAGLASYKLPATGTDKIQIQHAPFDTKAGQVWKVPLAYRRDSGTGVTFTGNMEWDDGSGSWALTASTLTLPAPTTTFAEKEQQVTSPSGARQGRLNLISTTTGAVILWIVLLAPITAATTPASYGPGSVNTASLAIAAVRPSRADLGIAGVAYNTGLDIPDQTDTLPDGFSVTGVWTYAHSGGVLTPSYVQLGNGTTGTNTLTSPLIQWGSYNDDALGLWLGMYVVGSSHYPNSGNVKVQPYDINKAPIGSPISIYDADSGSVYSLTFPVPITPPSLEPNLYIRYNDLPSGTAWVAVVWSITTTTTSQYLIIDAYYAYRRGIPISGNVLEVLDQSFVRALTISTDGLPQAVLETKASMHGLKLKASLQFAWRKVSADTTLNDNDLYVDVDTSGGNKTITIPAALNLGGRPYVVKKVTSDSNTVTLARSGSDTFEGVTSLVLKTQWARYRIYSNNVDTWEIDE